VACPVELFQAQDSSWALPLAETWQPFAENVRPALVPGGHQSFLRPPHARALAACITAAIEAEESRGD
jgi:thioesterase domain-containing protein